MIGKVHINIVDTYEDSTTAKRLYLAKDYLEDRFFLTYADGVADIDLNKWGVERTPDNKDSELQATRFNFAKYACAV